MKSEKYSIIRVGQGKTKDPKERSEKRKKTKET